MAVRCTAAPGLSENALQRQYEHSFRTLAEVIPQLVWTARADGQLDYLNQQWLDYTGSSRQQQLGLRWLALAIHRDDREAIDRAWRAAHRDGAVDLEFRLRRHDGVYCWFRMRGAAQRDADGAIIKWFGTCTDIDEHKRTQQEREHLLDQERLARAEAERIARLKDEFVATLSHELRTPLNAILGWAQMLQHDSADPVKRQKGLATIVRNARQQAQMVDDLLDMNRILSGKLQLTIRQFKLGDLVQTAVASVRALADARETAIVTDVGDADCCLSGDRMRLQQVVWHLLNNAIKFTPRRGTVTLSARVCGDEAEIRIADNGRGIAPDFIDLVFDRFRQADASNTRQVNGLGLGLAITRQLVDMHGGRIAVASEGTGKGATFTVTLPVAATDTQATQPTRRYAHRAIADGI